jgi:hypothetical protein
MAGASTTRSMQTQDVYLAVVLGITFQGLRVSNFAMESEQTFNGRADFGRRVACTYLS